MTEPCRREGAHNDHYREETTQFCKMHAKGE